MQQNAEHYRVFQINAEMLKPPTTNTTIIRVEDVKEIYKCSDRTAFKLLREARITLGKKPNNGGHRGGDPITKEQFLHAKGLNTPETK